MRNEAFDRANDRAKGGAISCATGTSASRFEAALAAIREAAATGDRAALLSQVGIPVMFIDRTGERRELRSTAEVNRAFDEVFDDEMLTLLSRARLDDIEVVPDRGAFLELGSVWLIVPEPGDTPRIVTVNRQALDEAAAAAARKAERKEGAPLPVDPLPRGKKAA